MDEFLSIARDAVIDIDSFLFDLDRFLYNFLDRIKDVSLLSFCHATAGTLCTSSQEHELAHEFDLLLSDTVDFFFVVLLGFKLS